MATVTTQPIRTAGDTNLVRAQTDPSTGVTSLVGAGGNISTLGSVLTVGAGGKYTTVQEAVNYIETQEAFTLLSTVDPAGAVQTWAQGSSDITLSGFLDITLPDIQNTVFKVAGDTNYYKVECVNAGASGGGAAHIYTKTPRIGANVSGTPAITWYRQNMFTILLLDRYVEEAFTISASIAVHISGVSNGTVFKPLITFGAAALDARVDFSGLRTGVPNGGDRIITGDATDVNNNIEINFLHGEVETEFEDFIYPETRLGSFSSRFTTWNHQPTLTAGNSISPRCRGDIVLQHLVWNVYNHAKFTSAAFDAGLVDKAYARKVIIDGCVGVVHDPFNNLAKVSFVGNRLGHIAAQEISVTNCSLACHDVSAVDLSVVEVTLSATYSTNPKVNVAGNVLTSSRGSGVLRLVHAVGSGSTADVKIGRGNNVSKCTALTGVTYSKPAPAVSGSATLAAETTKVVTHGLGYAPANADIRLVPTLMTAPVAYFITNATATEFTINLTASSTCAFDWAIVD